MNAGLNYTVRFPGDTGTLAIEDEYFFVELGGRERKINLDRIYRIHMINFTVSWRNRKNSIAFCEKSLFHIRSH